MEKNNLPTTIGIWTKIVRRRVCIRLPRSTLFRSGSTLYSLSRHYLERDCVNEYGNLSSLMMSGAGSRTQFVLLLRKNNLFSKELKGLLHSDQNLKSQVSQTGPCSWSQGLIADGARINSFCFLLKVFFSWVGFWVIVIAPELCRNIRLLDCFKTTQISVLKFQKSQD